MPAAPEEDSVRFSRKIRQAGIMLLHLRTVLIIFLSPAAAVPAAEWAAAHRRV